MEHHIRILRIVEEPGASLTGRLVPVLRIDFMVGEHGPFVERIAKTEFTGDVLREQLEAFARQLKGLPGFTG